MSELETKVFGVKYSSPHHKSKRKEPGMFARDIQKWLVPFYTSYYVAISLELKLSPLFTILA